ncbi:hypothetical protein CBI30_07390 [Polynucleobacter aenigmaticus]|uniref:Sialate O-acetylesterase domain-containing protein n=1 Tax=Polynucleobacter aenigmaticus TaxID=1743164 RepID=A0A254Q342_9BURK|nr:sialate O-acetylesterase [Polynucleobacter aenigmaticus]OWS71261.1 hypothetical protein CBI30_07390 [Polynucleobacter aenigmaticus]
MNNQNSRAILNRGLLLVLISLSIFSLPATAAEFDSFGRLTSINGKVEVVCPIQNKSTAVILVMGQSLSTNESSEKFSTKYPQSAINYFNGKCYASNSPLLGATGENGEFITALADLLIASKKYKTVIVISTGIGGTAINRWQAKGDLHTMVSKTIDQLSSTYKITQIIWQQGESDYLENTTTTAYINSFYSLYNALLSKKIRAPIFISISSKCGPNWIDNNPISTAQNLLIDNKKIFLGVNSDKLLDSEDRTPDECHLMGSGQLKIAKSYYEAFLKYSK